MKPAQARNLTATIFICLVVLFLRAGRLSPTFAADGSDAQWDSAVQTSRNSGKPTLVLFTASWCAGGQTIRAALRRADVAVELDHYCVYIVDLTHASVETQDHANRLGVDDVPQLIRFDTEQKETGRTTSLMADQLVQWLKDGE